MQEFGLNGQYGIENLNKGVDAANGMYDLFEKIYLDDRKFKGDDYIDLIGMGPQVAQRIIVAANGANQIGNEITDLSEAEKAQIVARAGERIEKPGYLKLLRGVLELVDGVSELKNDQNPVG
ncbi:MAG: hypothetical protein AAF242_00080 [Bacteroidota bacterium]